MKTILTTFAAIILAIFATFKKGKSLAKTEEKLNQNEELIEILKIQQDNAEYVRNATDKQLNDELRIFTKKRD